MVSELLQVGVLSACMLTAFNVTAGEAPKPVLGVWESGSRSDWDTKLSVTNHGVKFNSCAPVPYVVIQDDYGPGSGVLSRKPGEKWRNIALDLLPTNRLSFERDCSEFTVLEFSIADNNLCWAELSMYRSLEEYKARKPSSFSVWVNPSCVKDAQQIVPAGGRQAGASLN